MHKITILIIYSITKTVGKIKSMQLRLSSKDFELSQERAQTKKLTEQINQLEIWISQMLGERFQQFAKDCERYRAKAFSIVHKVDMWLGKVLKDKHNSYTADREHAKLLINGRTIEQHQAQAQSRGRGLSR